LRIIAGKYGKLRLATLNSRLTRPTSDKVKESLFDSLGQFFNGGQALDLYAGSGALGLEAVSRGMDHAVLVDISGQACRIIQKNIAATKQPEHFTLMRMPDKKALQVLAKQGQSFNLIFLDPPYAKQKIVKVMKSLLASELVATGGIVVAETDAGTQLDPVPGFKLLKEHRLGRTTVRFYQKEGAA
jgi:16S rRNA (guanine966-N2)-methyltransferase